MPSARLLLLSLALLLPALAPAQDPFAGDQVRIAFGSCAKESRPQPIWDRVSAREPHAFLWAGDNIYGDTEDMEVMRSKYAQLAAQPGYAALVASGIPILGTWDDHDYGVNDGGASYPQRAASQQAFLDFFGVAKDSPRRTRKGIHHAETFGPEGRRIQVILLDTRYHRSDLPRFRSENRRGRGYRPSRERNATMLGNEQWKWLEEQLREPAELRLIVSSIQFVAAEHRFEKWANLPRERSRMLRLIEDTGAEGVVFLSGDRHHAELSMLDRDGDYPIYDLTSSGLNQSNAPRNPVWRRPETNQSRLGRIHRGHHFGLVTVDWGKTDPLVTLEIVPAAGESPIAHQLRLSQLRKGIGNGPQTRAPMMVSGPTLDGATTDWPADTTLRAEGGSIWARVQLPFLTSVNAGDWTLEVAFDLDANESTGARRDTMPGTDLRLLYNQDGRRRDWRPTLLATDANGKTRRIDPGEVGFHVGPSHASDVYEMRFSRSSDLVLERLPSSGGPLKMRARWIPHQDAGQAAETRVLADVQITVGAITALPNDPASRAARGPTSPARIDGTIRAIAWNVLWAEPQKNPEPFARIFKTLDADVILLQEWDRDRYSAEELTTWFSKHVDSSKTWQAMVTGTGDFGQGTAIVTPHAITARAPAHLPVDGPRWDFPTRLAAAVVETPRGSVLAASLHFKSAGWFRSPEDRRRGDEAETVNALLRGMAAVAQPDVIVVGGDFNLVGDPHVLDTTVRHLDHDMSALAVAPARQLGDPSLAYTHGRGGLKSILDYVTWSDSSATLAGSFVLDSALLAPELLQASGLEQGDSAASDHFPIVLDLTPLTR